MVTLPFIYNYCFLLTRNFSLFSGKFFNSVSTVSAKVGWSDILFLSGGSGNFSILVVLILVYFSCANARLLESCFSFSLKRFSAFWKLLSQFRQITWKSFPAVKSVFRNRCISKQRWDFFHQFSTALSFWQHLLLRLDMAGKCCLLMLRESKFSWGKFR